MWSNLIIPSKASFSGLQPSAALSQLQLPKRSPQAAMVRDGLVECVYDASLCVVDSTGKVKLEEGMDLDFPIIARSSIKPLHAAFLYKTLLQKDPEKILARLTSKDWALLSASHAGNANQVAVFKNLIEKMKLDAKQLVCGVSEPEDKAQQRQLILDHQPSDIAYHPCSGHHAGQAYLGKVLNAVSEDYSDPNGPVQQTLLKFIQSLSNQPEKIRLVLSDGCNIPTVAIPSKDYAQMLARLAEDPEVKPVFKAMGNEPDLLGHPQKIDSMLMKITGGRLISKMGNHGLIWVAKPPSEIGQKAQVLLLKVWPGQGAEDPIRDKVVIEKLRQLGWLKPSEVLALQKLPQFSLVEYNTGGWAKGHKKLSYVV